MTFRDTKSLPLPFAALHPAARLPQYSTPGSAALDLTCIAGVTCPARAAVTIRTGLAVAIPDGFVFLLFSRSGHGFKNGLRLANCVGVIDSDYRGEIQVRLMNDSNTPFSFEPGDRIAQGLLIEIPRVVPVLREATSLSQTERGAGGFGSTGA